MKYADAPMNEVICEVMGTYNGICIAKGTNDAADFLRLAVEFEISGIRDVWLKDFKIIYPLFLFFQMESPVHSLMMVDGEAGHI